MRAALPICLLGLLFMPMIAAAENALAPADSVKTLRTDPPVAVVPDDPVAAEGNGFVIRDSQVRAAYRRWSSSDKLLDAAQYRNTLDRLIDQKVSAAAARNEGLADDPDVRQRIDLAVDTVLGDEFLIRKLRSATSDERLQSAYAAYVAEHPPIEEVRLERLSPVDAAKTAQALALLKAGGDFAHAVKLYHNPNMPDLGTVATTRLPQAVASAIENLPEGGVSDPVTTPFDTSVYRVVSRHTQPAPTFDEVRAQLQSKLATQSLEETVHTLRTVYAVHTVDAVTARVD